MNAGFVQAGKFFGVDAYDLEKKVFIECVFDNGG